VPVYRPFVLDPPRKCVSNVQKYGVWLGPRVHARAVTRFSLIGDVSSDNLAAVRPVITEVIGDATVTEANDGLHVGPTVVGPHARDVNRRLLSALRRAERRTRLRAEWTGDGQVHRFFDYVPKSTRPVAGG
jgi:hypothetical protein